MNQNKTQNLIQKYKFNDYKFFNRELLEGKYFYLWVPDKEYIILSKKNKYENSVFTDHLSKHKIEIVVRPSGGEPVLISPKMIMISIIIVSSNLEQSENYFDLINKLILICLHKFLINEACMRGISDICLGEKKILGSSIYRKKNKLLYHALLNYEENVRIIDYLLRHPVREPKYRKGRRHLDFITSIKAKHRNIAKSFFMNKLEGLFIENKFTQLM